MPLPSSWFWSVRTLPFKSILADVLKNDRATSSVIAAIVESGRSDLISETLAQVPPIRILMALSKHWSTVSIATAEVLDEWLGSLARAADAVAEFLVQANAPIEMLHHLARKMSPDAVPNDYGTDPWVLALRSVDRISVNGGDSIYFCASLLARGLGWRSQSPAELIRLSFEPVYTALSADKLPADAWQVLEERLPRARPNRYWDNCLRLRSVVAERFVERSLSPEIFANLCANDVFFAELASAVTRKSKGRRFLEGVRQHLEWQGSPATRRRAQIIEETIYGDD